MHNEKESKKVPERRPSESLKCILTNIIADYFNIFYSAYKSKWIVMRSPFLIVLLILMVPIAQLIIPGMVMVVILAAIYSIFREAYEALTAIGHRDLKWLYLGHLDATRQLVLVNGSTNLT